MELVSKLRKRSSDGDPIRVGIVGCGQMGSGLAHTIHNVGGMRVAAIADIDVERAITTYTEMGHARADIQVVADAGQAEDADHHAQRRDRYHHRGLPRPAGQAERHRLHGRLG